MYGNVSEQYRRSLLMLKQVKRDSQIVATINVDRPARATASVDPSWTPRLETSLNGSGPTQHLRDADSWSSPIFVKGKRLSSGSFFDASLDPFADDDGFIVGKGRKRTKFARLSDSWRLLDRTPSPEKESVDMRSNDVHEPIETAILLSQPQSPNQDVETIDERPMDGAPFESMPGAASAASGNSQSLLYQPESPHAEILPPEPDCTQNPDFLPHEAGQMRPPTSPPRKAPRASDMVIDSISRKEIQTLAQSNLETPRLGPLPSPGLPLVSPLIARPGLPSGYFPDTSDHHSELDASGDQQQSLPVTEARVASNNAPAPSLDTEQVPLLRPAEAEKPPTPESEVASRDTLSEFQSATEELYPQLDRPIRAVSWSSFHEEVQQTPLVPQEQAQLPVNAADFDFEFPNTSSIETDNDGQIMWHLPETSAGSVATLEAHKDAGLLESAEASTPPADLPGDVADPMLQYENQIASVKYDLNRSDTTTPLVREATQDENFIAISEGTPDSPPRVSLDPGLATTLEAATGLITRSKENAQVTEELPEQVSDSRLWSDKLDLSAVDAESQHVYNAPPFPFQQGWHRRPSSQRSRHSSQYPSLDGTSDEISGDESSVVEDVSDGSHQLETLGNGRQSEDGVETGKDIRASTPPRSSPQDDGSRHRNTHIPSKDIIVPNALAPIAIQSVVVLDSSDEDADSVGRREITGKNAISSFAVGPPEDAVDLKASEIDKLGNETRINTDQAHDLQTVRIENPILPPSSAHGEPSSLTIDTTGVPKTEGSQTEMSPIERQDLTGESSRPPTEPTKSTRPLDDQPVQQLRYQLVTPESTQQEGGGDIQLQDRTAELGLENPLPPTPQNTQEHVDLPQPTVELPITDIEAFQTPKMPLPTTIDDLRERRRSPRLSRKFPPSHDVTEVVSPYFTPRRTSQMRAQDWVTTPHRPTIVKLSQAAANDTTQMTEKDKKLNDNDLLGEEIVLGSPLTLQPKAGLTTSLSYYTPLSLLRDHFSQSVDVLALATTASTEPQKAKSGPKDWHTTLHLAEPSLPGNKSITAQIFRPYKAALPKVQRGNLVLLRSVKVQSQKRKCMLLSTELSAWAVFSVRREMGGQVSDIDVVIDGPPVELGSEEKSHIIELEKWWGAEGEGQHPSQMPADQTSKAIPAAKNGDAGEATHELRDGSEYQDNPKNDGHLKVSAPYHELRDGTLYKDETTTKPSNSDAVSKLNDSTPVFHELRDGTLYQDDTTSRMGRDSRRRSIATLSDTSPKSEESMAIQEKISQQEDQDANYNLESGNVEVTAEGDSSEESPTDEAVSTQIYHELRNGRRYADPAPAQKHAEELQQTDGQDGNESVIHELRDGVTYTDE
jgi:hypothetical protein